MPDKVKAAFEVVEPTEVPNRTTGQGRPMSPITLALLDGKTIFVVGERDWAFRKTLSSRGRRLHTRRAERDGVKGVYLWTEEIKVEGV